MKTYIIDNHPLFMDSLAQLVSLFQQDNTIYKYIQTLDAIEALDKTSLPSLIFINISMPKLDGLGFLKVLQKRQILTPVIMLSDNDDIKTMKKALAFDIAGFIPKTHSHAQIQHALNQIFNGNTYIPETVELRLSRIKDLTTGRIQMDSSINALGVTRRQREVLKLAAQGHANKSIALMMNISEHTVKSHLAAMFQLLHAKSRAECVQRAYQTGLIAPPDNNSI
ncbi:hypothetical protein MNBD_GAMMA23-666 [hydrothermal vent metagenome]|uniref:Two-component transcriptional response regulator, LuxR family n=1 Tax=hydrothermal vent metagenome TaxID=652676 RepID=A0A3B1AID2_9ZZZZ